MNSSAFPARILSLVLAALLLAGWGIVASGKRTPRFHRVFKVRGASHFNLKNILGSITIKTWPKSRIKVEADVSPSAIEVREGEGEVHIVAIKSPNPATINFVASVPSDCNLKLTNLGGKIVVRELRGNVEAETTDGDIELTEMLSDYVVASSTSGRVAFFGEIVPGGRYDLHSLNNTVDVTVSEASSFKLSATSMNDSIDLGGFEFSDMVRGKRITGTYSKGGALLNLTTYQGSVHLHKR